MKKFILSIAATITALIVFAQEKSAEINVDVDKNSGGNWYAAPWVWVVGGAVFILLLVALLRGNRRSDA